MLRARQPTANKTNVLLRLLARKHRRAPVSRHRAREKKRVHFRSAQQLRLAFSRRRAATAVRRRHCSAWRFAPARISPCCWGSESHCEKVRMKWITL